MTADARLIALACQVWSKWSTAYHSGTRTTLLPSGLSTKPGSVRTGKGNRNP